MRKNLWRNLVVSFRILTVIENRILGPYILIRIEDSDIHRKAKCGQFVMVGFPCSLDPFLLRPLSFLSFDKNSFTILIKTRGRGTNKLAKVKKGEKLKVLGPLGNAINPSKSGVLIAGGIGIAPLYYHSQWMKHGVLFYGEKRAKDLVLRKEFENRGFKGENRRDMMGDLEALYIAYSVIWLGLFGYLVYLHMKQIKLANELKLLEEMVKKE